MITTNFQHSTFGIAILWAKISCLMPFIIPYILGRMENQNPEPEPEPETETEMELEPELEPELKLRPG